jgi:hypothetical protein
MGGEKVSFSISQMFQPLPHLTIEYAGVLRVEDRLLVMAVLISYTTAIAR